MHFFPLLARQRAVQMMGDCPQSVCAGDVLGQVSMLLLRQNQDTIEPCFIFPQVTVCLFIAPIVQTMG